MSLEIMQWRAIFARWLRERPALDRIDYADVFRIPGQQRGYVMDGLVVTLRRGE